MNFPDFFKLKTGSQSQLTHIPMEHKHVTTTDFFKVQPLCARYVVPKDKMDIDVTSFVRFFPMPFPVFGRVKYYNRCFFVPFRQIAEGWNQFIDDVDYPSNNGFVRIQSAPYFTNKAVCDAFYSSYTDSATYPLISPIDQTYYYWRKYNENMFFLVDALGKVVSFHDSNNTLFIAFYKDADGQIYICDSTTTQFNNATIAFKWEQYGSFTSAVASGVTTYTISDSNMTATYKFQCGINMPSSGAFTVASNVTLPPFSSTTYETVKYDFMFGLVPYRFTNRGRYFYSLLCSLGYRINWTNANGQFQVQKKFNAGKLLAFLKIYLDWYTPSAYADVNNLRMLFRGVASSGRVITYQEILDISQNVEFACYDRDYFTSAWKNPNGPNVTQSGVVINDPTVKNLSSASSDYRSQVRNNNNIIVGSNNGTPTINGVNTLYNGTESITETPNNISYYILESLRALTNWARRNQLSGNRPVDRHLANFGVKLNDDRVDRCYYIGGYSYDADIMDIMSTADTEKAALGDYAGKGIAYSDAHRSFHFESDEHGYIIVVSSVVPEVGYVQGVMRENLDLTRFELQIGDFDNIGTQAQRNDELFGDSGMPMPDGSEVVQTIADDGVRGWVPRYAHLKCGADFLTGDFIVPSRREGLDAFHLFRLFNNPNIPSINKDFLIGEQKQYDRIFNNTDDDYDHMYTVNRIFINAQRPMKSISEVYDFEHSDGREIEVAANGTQLN